MLLGITYKENVADIRESKALEILKMLLVQGTELYYCDPVFARRQRDLYPEPSKLGLRQLRLVIANGAAQDAHGDHEEKPQPKDGVGVFSIQEVDIAECFEQVRLRKIDAVVVFADHDEFTDKLYGQLITIQGLQIIDTRNALTRKLGYRPAGIAILGETEIC